jgi:hypothetical protein
MPKSRTASRSLSPAFRRQARQALANGDTPALRAAHPAVRQLVHEMFCDSPETLSAGKRRRGTSSPT